MRKIATLVFFALALACSPESDVSHRESGTHVQAWVSDGKVTKMRVSDTPMPCGTIDRAPEKCVDGEAFVVEYTRRDDGSTMEEVVEISGCRIHSSGGAAEVEMELLQRSDGEAQIHVRDVAWLPAGEVTAEICKL